MDWFATVSKKWRIGPTPHDVVDFPIVTGDECRGLLEPRVEAAARGKMNFVELSHRQLLEDHAPVSVLINGKHEILFFHGLTGNFLEPPTGEPIRDLIAMAGRGRRTKLRAVCHEAIRDHQPVIDATPRVKRNVTWHPCTITARQIVERQEAEGVTGHNPGARRRSACCDQPGCGGGGRTGRRIRAGPPF